MDLGSKKITVGVMAVDKTHRRKGYARALIQKLKNCVLKKVSFILAWVQDLEYAYYILI